MNSGLLHRQHCCFVWRPQPLPFHSSTYQPIVLRSTHKRRSAQLAPTVQCAAAGAVSSSAHQAFAAQSIALIAKATGDAKRKAAETTVATAGGGAAGVIAGLPLWVVVPVALLSAVFLLRFVLRFFVGRRGSLAGLEDRGMLDEDRDQSTRKGDRFESEVMRNVNKVSIEALTEEQIMAARQRRSQERLVVVTNMDEVELPENHPFAVNRKLSKEEEALIQARLSARRGLPPQDLGDSPRARGQQAGSEDGGRAAPPQQGQRGPFGSPMQPRGRPTQ